MNFSILFSSIITCARICADNNPTMMDHCAVYIQVRRFTYGSEVYIQVKGLSTGQKFTYRSKVYMT